LAEPLDYRGTAARGDDRHLLILLAIKTLPLESAGLSSRSLRTNGRWYRRFTCNARDSSV